MEQVIRWYDVKTRIPHECFGCGLKYPSGTIMASATYVDGNEIKTIHWCETCEEYMRRHFERGDQTEYGGIYHNDPEEWEAIQKEICNGSD